MHTDIYVTILGALGSILAIAIGYLFGRRQERYSYNKEISIEAWKVRSGLYVELIQLMDKFPLYPNRIGKATVMELKQTSLKLRSWYYKGGGLFLTAKSRSAYLAVQRHINSVLSKLETNASEQTNNSFLTEKQYLRARRLLSSLRTELTKDLVSRERNILLNKHFD